MTRFIALLVLLAATMTAARADGHLVDFLLPDANGQMHRLSDHRGKWVVINFWATWCGPCMVEIPELIRFHERRKDRDAIVIGVNFEEIDTPDLVKFIADMGINYLVVRAGDKPILPFEPLKGLPSTFFVDPHGELVASHAGPVTDAAIEDFLEREAQRSGEAIDVDRTSGSAGRIASRGRWRRGECAAARSVATCGQGVPEGERACVWSGAESRISRA